MMERAKKYLDYQIFGLPTDSSSIAFLLKITRGRSHFIYDDCIYSIGYDDEIGFHWIKCDPKEDLLPFQIYDENMPFLWFEWYQGIFPIQMFRQATLTHKKVG